MFNASQKFYCSQMLMIFFSTFFSFLTVSEISGTNKNPVADFDGDGKSDVSVFRPSDGYWYITKSSGGYSIVKWGISTDMPVPGDYDNDGKMDLAVFRRTPQGSLIINNIWYILRSSDGAFNAVTFVANSPWYYYDSPIPADYDADGITDLAVFRTSDAISDRTDFMVLQSSTNSQKAIRLGNTAIHNPVPADYDGDGRTDFAIYRRGTWTIINSSDNTTRTEYFGLNNDVFAPGDYDGDGKADLAVCRAADGFLYWYRINSKDKSFSAIQFGLSTDRMTPADYDGDGKTDIAVFRPSTGVWYLLQSTEGFEAQQFGLKDDIPIPNVFVRSLYSIDFPGF